MIEKISTKDMANGIIEVDLFAEDMDNLDDPEVQKFKLLLEQVGDDHDCELIHFTIAKGTVSFAFDNEDLMVKIIKILQDEEDMPEPSA